MAKKLKKILVVEGESISIQDVITDKETLVVEGESTIIKDIKEDLKSNYIVDTVAYSGQQGSEPLDSVMRIKGKKPPIV